MKTIDFWTFVEQNYPDGSAIIRYDTRAISRPEIVNPPAELMSDCGVFCMSQLWGGLSHTGSAAQLDQNRKKILGGIPITGLLLIKGSGGTRQRLATIVVPGKRVGADYYAQIFFKKVAETETAYQPRKPFRVIQWAKASVSAPESAASAIFASMLLPFLAFLIVF